MLNLLLPRDDDPFAGFRYYYYSPSTAAAILFIVLFGLSTILHSYQMIRTRAWFLIPFCIGGACEATGYIGRIIFASQPDGDWTLPPYILQATLLLISPALLAASVYMQLGRLVQLMDGEKHLIIRRTWMTKIFVSGDVLSFLMQGSGGGLMSGHDLNSIHVGQKIIVGGLFVQIVFFIFFIITATLFHIRMNKSPTDRSQSVPWRNHMCALYVISALILDRSIVRVWEYLQGYSGYILRHEVFLYIFDATLIFTAMVIWNWYHPSEVRSLLRGGKSFRGVRLQNIQPPQDIPPQENAP